MRSLICRITSGAFAITSESVATSGLVFRSPKRYRGAQMDAPVEDPDLRPSGSSLRKLLGNCRPGRVLPIWGVDPIPRSGPGMHFQRLRMQRRDDSLIGQIVA